MLSFITGLPARALAIGAAVLAGLGMVLTILAGARKAGVDKQKAADLAERLEQENRGNEAANRARGERVTDRLRDGRF